MANAYITVRATDTDVLIILLYHVNINNTKVTMDVGNSGQNNRRYIDITSLADDLGSEICHALPGVHAFTGCDYTAAMVRRGKIKPLNLAKKEQRF